MGVLLRGLPAEARLARLPVDPVVWTTRDELLARLLEETSVLAADKRRKKPLELPRPASIREAEEEAKPTVNGLTGLVAMAEAAGRVRHV